ncbi:MAG: ABC transporter ATP-binding protein [Paralcaligenes sp.]
MMPLEVSNIIAGYGRVMILDSVCIRLGSNEIICIAGPNGAGKSTLLKAIAGIVPWQSGQVSLFGAAAVSGETSDEARSVLGVVPQVNNVFPSLTVYENLLVVLPSRWVKHEKKLALERIYEMFPDLYEIRSKPGANLSGGQRQSVAFAMALVRKPKLLLLDEPSAALAPIAAQAVFKRIVQLKESGIPILLVEQNVRAAMEIADRAYFLENGRNFLDGDVSVLRDDPRIRKIYLGA